MADLISIIAAPGSVKTLWELARNAQDAQLAMKISAELGNIQGQLIDVQHQAIALLESVLNDLFATHDISVRDAFTVRGDEGEGSGQRSRKRLHARSNRVCLKATSQRWRWPIGCVTAARP
jgi:hypothetical protein